MSDDMYWLAPPILREAADLLDLSQRRAEHAGTDEDLDQEAERVYLLRRAALADRIAIEVETAGVTGAAPAELADADTTAAQLLHHDRVHDMVPAGVGIPPYGTSDRLYVRACYDAWGW